MKNKQKDNVQTINLTHNQFLSLMKVVYLGNWMANAHRTKDIQKEYENIQDYIYSKASQFGFEKYVDHEGSDGERYYPTSLFEELTDVHKLHEAYDEETFWDEMAERFGERDFVEKYSKEEIIKMSQEEYFIKLSECIDFYNEEFVKFGLQRIRLEDKKHYEYN